MSKFFCWSHILSFSICIYPIVNSYTYLKVYVFECRTYISLEVYLSSDKFLHAQTWCRLCYHIDHFNIF